MQEVSASEAQTQTELLKEIMGHIYGPKIWQFFQWSKTWAIAIPKRNSIISSWNTGAKFYQKWDPIQKLLHQTNKKAN